MRIFFITISGVYIVIAGLLIAAMLFMSLFFLDEESAQLPMNYSPFFLVISYLPLVLWFLTTGSGLIAKRSWARYSALIMSYFTLFIGLVIFITFFLLPPSEKITASHNQFKLLFLSLVVLLFIIVPAFFLIFLNRKSTKSLFVTKDDKSSTARRPLGITLIAIITILSGLFSFFYALFPDQKIAVSNSVFLSGFFLRVYCWLLTFVNFYIAMGLLRLQKAGWLVSVTYHSLSIMVLTLNIVAISEQTLLEIMPETFESPASAFILSYRVFCLLSLIVSVLILIYITSRKKLFFRN